MDYICNIRYEYAKYDGMLMDADVFTGNEYLMGYLEIMMKHINLICAMVKLHRQIRTMTMVIAQESNHNGI